jgi:hypothetical protein
VPPGSTGTSNGHGGGVPTEADEAVSEQVAAMRMAGLSGAEMLAALREEKAKAVDEEDFALAAAVAKALKALCPAAGAATAAKVGAAKAGAAATAADAAAMAASSYSSLPSPARRPAPSASAKPPVKREEEKQRKAAASMFDSMMDDF